MNKKDSKNARQSKKTVHEVTKKTELKALGNIVDDQITDNGDHPLWRAASIQDKMNILFEVTYHDEKKKIEAYKRS